LSATNQGLIALTMEIEEKTKEIQELTEQLWRVARMATMGELAASVAHELNNPLATISLRLESLAGQIPPDDPKQRSLQIIAREIERMAALVNRLLDFSRRGHYHQSAVDICREVDYALELINHHFHKQGISIIKEYQPKLPSIYADCQGLQQVFINLFINASDAMPNGGVLTVRIYSSAEHIAIDIIDTGLGIQPNDLAKVMDPFFTTKPAGKGTGLGLSICRRIVEEHGGIITINSVIDRGTTVGIKLPLMEYGPALPNMDRVR